MQTTTRTLAVLCMALLFVATTRGQISVRGGNVTLNITTAVAGSEPTPVVSTATSVRYSAPAKLAKITVQTACPSQNFTLTVVATGVTRGTAQAAVTLQDGAAATDFITSIPTGWGGNSQPTLQYTASALFSQGTGNDRHTVTYTYLAQ